jgi:hypothetical protein
MIKTGCKTHSWNLSLYGFTVILFGLAAMQSRFMPQTHHSEVMRTNTSQHLLLAISCMYSCYDCCRKDVITQVQGISLMSKPSLSHTWQDMYYFDLILLGCVSALQCYVLLLNQYFGSATTHQWHTVFDKILIGHGNTPHCHFLVFGFGSLLLRGWFKK